MIGLTLSFLWLTNFAIVIPKDTLGVITHSCCIQKINRYYQREILAFLSSFVHHGANWTPFSFIPVDSYFGDLFFYTSPPPPLEDQHLPPLKSQYSPIIGTENHSNYRHHSRHQSYCPLTQLLLGLLLNTLTRRLIRPTRHFLLNWLAGWLASTGAQRASNRFCLSLFGAF